VSQSKAESNRRKVIVVFNRDRKYNVVGIRKSTVPSVGGCRKRNLRRGQNLGDSCLRGYLTADQFRKQT
jgi:hypothetical protein